MGQTPGKLNLINKIKPDGGNNNSQQPGESYTAVLENDEIVITNSATGEESRIKKTPEVWEPFTDEFFQCNGFIKCNLYKCRRFNYGYKS